MSLKVSVVIPTYKAKAHILNVISKIPPEVYAIYIVDDLCPEHSGAFVLENNTDPRVKVISSPHNLGVGGAVMLGYRSAIKDGMDILVKIDSDGQMDPKLISKFTHPIIRGEADYTKGNRFFSPELTRSMPKIRLFGNAALSLLTKVSSGYWNIFDPTNGYTAIHAKIAQDLPFSKISNRYFFESDMLFRLNLIQAVVLDIPMKAFYGDEKSNLSIKKIFFEFLFKNTRNFLKRIFYKYYLRDMSLASIELPIGSFLVLFGMICGIYHWLTSLHTHQFTSSGTVMLAALPILTGTQLLLNCIGYDITTIPKRPIWPQQYNMNFTKTPQSPAKDGE